MKRITLLTLILSLILSFSLSACDLSAKPSPTVTEAASSKSSAAGTDPTSSVSASVTKIPNVSVKPSGLIPSEAPIPAPTASAGPAPSASKVYPDKPLIYDQYAKELEYTESKTSPPYHYSFHVPAINLDTRDAAQINEEIKEFCMPKINESLSQMNTGVSAITLGCTYQVYEYSNVISVLIRLWTQWNTTRYKVYSIDNISGKKLNNSDLLAEKNLSDDKFLNASKETMTARFKKQFVDEPTSPEDIERYNKTISTNNLNTEMPMFIDFDGTLNIIARIYSPAGAESYYYVLDINR